MVLDKFKDEYLSICDILSNFGAEKVLDCFNWKLDDDVKNNIETPIVYTYGDIIQLKSTISNVRTR